MDAPVPVPGMAVGENLADRGLERRLRIGSLQAGLVVEKSGPGEPGDVQQDAQRILGLEGDDGLDLHCRPCSFKARSFPR